MNATILKNAASLQKLLNPCVLCPRNCGVNRLAGQKGKCGAAADILVASHNLHFSEEPPISGTKGSGTIFFSNCSLSCVFCQNYPLSQLGHGNPVSVEKLADMMLDLQGRGAHNINFVTPTHYSAQMAQAVVLAKQRGFKLPVLYNTSGYDSVTTLKLLDGIVDIYMPDAKYSDNLNSIKYSGAPGYWEVNKAALKEMFRQAGDLRLDENGIAVKGLIIRHLVLPDNISGSAEVLRFIAENISNKVFLSLMAQYHPANKAENYPELSRKINSAEYEAVLKIVDELGFENGWTQEL